MIDNILYVSHYIHVLCTLWTTRHPSGRDSGLYSSGELRSYEQVRAPTTWAPTTRAPTTWVPTDLGTHHPSSSTL